MDLAFATYSAFPALAEDDRLVVEPLRSRSIDVHFAAWDDPSIDWQRFDGIVLRSTWNYHLHISEFVRWLARLEELGVAVWNPLDLVRWNVDKRYLGDLARRGIPIVPTVWLDQDGARPLDDILQERGWDQAIVKPTVSATAYETWITTPESARSHQARLDALLQRSGVMIQPFMRQILADGEWSLIYFDGAFSHAVRKRAQSGDFRVQEEHGGQPESVQPSAELIASARRALDVLEHPWLYARVDGVAEGGELVLMELELVEPALYLATDPLAPQHFADAIGALFGA